MRTVFTLVVFVLSFVNHCASQSSSIYNVNWKKDRYAIGAGVALSGINLYLVTKQTAVTEAKVLSLDPMNLSSIDFAAINNNNRTSKVISDQMRNFCLLFPLTTLVTQKGKNEFPALSIMYIETILFTTSITFFSKVAVTRARPFLYNDEIPLSEKLNKDADHSFFSGHVSIVSSMSYFTASVLSDLHPNSKYKWAWWTGAIALPAITAYTRFDAGKHFVSDVIVGYGVGALIGYFIPKIHKFNSNKVKVDLLPTNSSVSVSFRYNIS